MSLKSHWAYTQKRRKGTRHPQAPSPGHAEGALFSLRKRPDVFRRGVKVNSFNSNGCCHPWPLRVRLAASVLTGVPGRWRSLPREPVPDTAPGRPTRLRGPSRSNPQNRYQPRRRLCKPHTHTRAYTHPCQQTTHTHVHTHGVRCQMNRPAHKVGHTSDFQFFG